MDGDALHSIGDVARRTGLTVKTIRFYSDEGVVPPSGRSPAGHRLYGADAMARLDLVRTLRDLGLDLSTIRRVLAREVTLAEVAAAHADALGVRIRTLRLRRAVLTVLAGRGTAPEEMELMHKLAKLSEDERERLIGDFLDAVLGDVDARPGFAGVRRSLTPVLPDDPAPEQVEAWVELAGLAQDPDFRASVRRMADQHAADQHAAVREVIDRNAGRSAAERNADRRAAGPPRRDAVALVRDLAGPALTAGVDPGAPEAAPVVEEITARYARLLGRPDAPDLRRELLARLETAGDPRRERYLQLLAVINGWPAPERLSPALSWCAAALRAVA